ncbi:MAG: CDP-diacylglycerol--serine O-phosphatidyltransferase [Bacteroidaceae bacterium]|nr:CDP-diacylglycerol--serine O-phosphatidyltransferase [Bacteroidaceae bacterium]
MKHLPNFLTCCNLFSGCVATVMALQADYTAAFVFIILGALFDFLDGMAARLLKAFSPIGADLDSLADQVSFGVAPSAMLFSLLGEITLPTIFDPIVEVVPYLGFLIAIFSGLRLAKFNVDTRQTTSFIGLPVPANALFWGSLIVAYREELFSHDWLLVPLFVGILLFSYLLVSELPMFSLKFKSLSWKANKVSYSFLLVCVPLIIFFGIGSLAFIILWYILLSALTQRKKVQ